MSPSETTGPFPVTCWIESGDILRTGRGPSSGGSVLCSASDVLGDHHKSCSSQAQFLCARAGEQDLNTIYRESSTRVARPSHPHHRFILTVTWPVNLSKCLRDSSGPRSSPSQRKSKLKESSMAMGQETAFLICSNTQTRCHLQGGSATKSWKLNIEGKVVHSFPVHPRIW